MKQSGFFFIFREIFSVETNIFLFFVPRKFHQERVVLIEILKYLNYHFYRHFGVSSNKNKRFFKKK